MQLEYCIYLLIFFFTLQCFPFYIHATWGQAGDLNSLDTCHLQDQDLPALSEDAHIMFWLRCCREWIARPQMYKAACLEICIKCLPRFLHLRRESGELGFSCSPWFLLQIPSLRKGKSDLCIVAFVPSFVKEGSGDCIFMTSLRGFFAAVLVGEKSQRVLLQSLCPLWWPSLWEMGTMFTAIPPPNL